MHRIQPSQRIREELHTLLEEGNADAEAPLSQFLLKALQLVAQELLEAEQRDYLGRDHYQRNSPEDETDHRGYRNGYRRRRLKTAEGEVSVQVPQLRDTPEAYRSHLADFLSGNTDVLESLATQMYTRGLSTRDIEDAFKEATGDPLLSRTAVSEITERLWDEYEEFCERNLSDYELEYLFLDGVYEGMRPTGSTKESVLVAWGMCRDGNTVLIHVALGSTESTPAWRDFIRDLCRRGLREPVLAVTDGAPGAIAAVSEVWPNSLRQRCLAHKMRNVLAKVPKDAHAEVKEHVRACYYAPTQEVAHMLRDEVNERFADRYPSAMRSFNDDFEACIAHIRCPTVHRRRIRTTNLAERAIQEERRRTKVIPRFFSEKACLKLAFSALWQASCRWRGVRMSDIEIRQLQHLRRELGIEPRNLNDARKSRASAEDTAAA